MTGNGHRICRLSAESEAFLITKPFEEVEKKSLYWKEPSDFENMAVFAVMKMKVETFS